MSETLLAKAERKLKLWEDAEDACASGQAYQMGRLQLTRANLETIRDQVRYYEGKVARLKSGRSGGPRNVYVVPRG